MGATGSVVHLCACAVCVAQNLMLFSLRLPLTVFRNLSVCRNSCVILCNKNSFSVDMASEV